MVSGEWLAHGDTLVMCMESSRKILDESSVEDDDTQTEEPFGDAPTDTKAAENLGRKNSAKENSSKQESTIMFENRADSGNEPISILIEIVGATLPKQLISGGVKWEDSRGMHCTAHWVGPPNPSGRKRKEELLHRTKSLKVDGGSKNAKKIIDMEDETHEDDHHVEHIFTVDDKSLFLFKTTMKQLVNASPKSSSSSSQPPSKTDSEEGNAIMRKGGIRFDVFLKPLDALSTVSSYIAASTVSEKEASAITSCESSFSSSMMASYRLMGSIFLTADDILNRCTEERFEVNLNGKLRQIQQNPQLQISTGFGQPGRTLNKPNTDGRLALRMRLASDCDKAFLKSLAASDVCYDVVKNYATLQSSISRHDKCYTNALKPLQLLTEIDENVLAAQSSIKALSFMAPVAHESVRYLFSDDKVPRVLVKPYPDPERQNETAFLTEAELREECFKPSTNWIKAGSGSLGKVYLEILQCQGLPNVDTGGSLGNKTDSFVSIVYGDVMVQTDCIDDILSPMWLPWTQRAFVLDMSHPSTALYIAVTDYDVGPLEHENIGRVAINIGTRFTPGLVYTLTYRLNESSSFNEFGEDNIGTITLRLRVEYDEKMHLTMGKSPPPRQWVNSTQYKTHRVAKYACDGPHDKDTFEMRLFRSHINEIMTQKQTLTYLIKDSLYSLIFWKPQVKVGGVWLPLHSALAFYFGVHVVENPRLLPSLVFFFCGWIMIANMMHRQNHPNPWHRGHSFLYYWNVLVYGKSFAVPKEIPSFEHHKDSLRFEKFYTDRLEEDNARYAKQVELSQKLADISNDANIRTKAKANAPLVDPISAVAGARLLPYQQRLANVCDALRYYRNILNWNESVVSFWITMLFFGLALISLLIPWGFVLQWSCRLVVWVFLGPWMKLVDVFLHGMTLEEEKERQKSKSLKTLLNSFQEQRKRAKVLRENALKLKAFRVKLFGKYITRLPELNLSRHEDTPMPESTAELYHGDGNVRAKMIVPGQNLCGAMIPTLGKTTSIKSNQTERAQLINQYQNISQLKQDILGQGLNVELNEGFELVNADNQLVCLQSVDSAENSPCGKSMTDVESTALVNIRRESIRDVVISDNAIQEALERRLHNNTEMRKPKSSWAFSASINVSITKKSLVDQQLAPSNEMQALCNGSNSKRHLIKQSDGDEVEEEGIEVVPILTTNNFNDSPSAEQAFELNDRVSVFFVDDKRMSIHEID